MAGIDKQAFMKRLSAKGPAPSYGDDVAGAEPEESAEGEMTCGEQLVAALGITGADTAGVDAALREAVRKYSKE